MNLRSLRRHRLAREAWLVANPSQRHWTPVGAYRRVMRAAFKHPGRTATDGHGGYALYLPPDPELEKEEFVRQLTERRSPRPGESPPMVGGIGRIETIQFMVSATLR